MNRKYSLLLVLITAVFELAFLVWTRADYRSTLLDGEEYEVPAAIEFHGNFYDRNYIAVNVPINEVGRRAGTGNRRNDLPGDP